MVGAVPAISSLDLSLLCLFADMNLLYIRTSERQIRIHFTIGLSGSSGSVPFLGSLGTAGPSPTVHQQRPAVQGKTHDDVRALHACAAKISGSLMVKLPRKLALLTFTAQTHWKRSITGFPVHSHFYGTPRPSLGGNGCKLERCTDFLVTNRKGLS